MTEIARDDLRVEKTSPGSAQTSGSSVAAVELRNISKQYGENVALHALDLDIADGEFISLLGPSGCGKTTTLKLIAGFEEPSTGSVFIGGVEAQSLPPNKRDVNTVFQSYSLFPHMTVLDNVAYGLKQRRVGRTERRQQAMDALAMVGLEHRAAARPTMLSGGQQQRVALARALVLRPRVLLLDEPLSALDLKLRQQMQIELKRIHREVGITFVFVTHDQGEAMTMSDRIAVMNAGRIEQLDSPQAIYDSPKTAFVAGFIGEMNVFQGVAGAGDMVTVPGAFTTPAGHVIARVPDGSPARFGVRPQDLTVSTGQGTANATINDAMTVGHELQIVGQLDDGQKVIMLHNRYADSTAYRPGDRVRVEPLPNAALLLGAAGDTTELEDKK